MEAFQAQKDRARSDSDSGSQLRRAPGVNMSNENKHFLEENLQRDYIQCYYREHTKRVTTNADTQLGAFGPGADPTRSRAAYPPPRLAVNLFTCCCFDLLFFDVETLVF